MLGFAELPTVPTRRDHGARVKTTPAERAPVSGRRWPYCGVLGEFLLGLPLPRVIYMLDYYLPQLQPWDKGDLHALGTIAAPVHFGPQNIYIKFSQQDDEFCYYTFFNEGGAAFIMTPTSVRQCQHTMHYVRKYEGGL